MLDLAQLVDRVAPILVFLVAITLVAELCDQAGLFDEAAHWAARLARGRVAVLWLLVIALAVVSTVVLSLDTTAVLLTPVAVTGSGVALALRSLVLRRHRAARQGER